jgi:hypothetical protein
LLISLIDAQRFCGNECCHLFDLFFRSKKLLGLSDLGFEA